jgi:hypothetical protein
MSRLEVHFRKKLDCLDEERILYRRAAGWIAGSSNCANRRASHHVEDANEQQHGDQNADCDETYINEDLQLAIRVIP